ncbi:BEACH domain-containing protein [Plasmodiophora brassicae]
MVGCCVVIDEPCTRADAHHHVVKAGERMPGFAVGDDAQVWVIPAADERCRCGDVCDDTNLVDVQLDFGRNVSRASVERVINGKLAADRQPGKPRPVGRIGAPFGTFDDFRKAIMGIVHALYEDQIEPSSQRHIFARKHACVPDLVSVVEDGERAIALLFRASPYTLESYLREPDTGACDNEFVRLFRVFQAVHAVRVLHSNGIAHGDVSLGNFQFSPDSNWMQLSCIASPAPIAIDRGETASGETASGSSRNLCLEWVSGRMSNYEYILELNRLAGRFIRRPHCHPVFPWVSDFSDRWAGTRDLSKSKFRLKKGDEQLDFTYKGASGNDQRPHHVPEMLSDLTLCVYLARRVPVSRLTAEVRCNFEPNEYPSTMAQMYQWTPDECIPEFFSDPTVFESLHKDLGLPDLKCPEWCASPKEFVEWHRSVLESPSVSAQIHRWLDLTFGYLLSGKPAVDAKNVPIVPKGGFCQLFTVPHPKRFTGGPDEVEAVMHFATSQFAPLCVGQSNRNDCPLEADLFALGKCIYQIMTHSRHTVHCDDRIVLDRVSRPMQILVHALLSPSPPSSSDILSSQIFPPGMHTLHEFMSAIRLSKSPCDCAISLLQTPALMRLDLSLYLLLVPACLSIPPTARLLELLATRLGPGLSASTVQLYVDGLLRSRSPPPDLLSPSFVQTMSHTIGRTWLVQRYLPYLCCHAEQPGTNLAMFVSVIDVVDMDTAYRGVLLPLASRLPSPNALRALAATASLSNRGPELVTPIVRRLLLSRNLAGAGLHILQALLPKLKPETAGSLLLTPTANDDVPLLLHLLGRPDVVCDPENATSLLAITESSVLFVSRADVSGKVASCIVDMIRICLNGNHDPEFFVRACNLLTKITGPAAMAQLLPADLVEPLHDRISSGSNTVAMHDTPGPCPEPPAHVGSAGEPDVIFRATWEFYDKDGTWTLKPSVRDCNSTVHSSAVTHLAVHPNLGIFATMSHDQAQLWRVTPNRSLKSARQICAGGHEEPALIDMCWADAAARVATATERTVKLWDASTGVCARAIAFEPDLAITSLASHTQTVSSRNCLISGTSQASVHILDLRVGRRALQWRLLDASNRSSPDTTSVRRIVTDRSGLKIACGLANGSVFVLDSRTGIILLSWKAHDGSIVELLFFRDDLLLTSGANGSVCVWKFGDDSATSTPRLVQRIRSSAPVSSIVCHGSDIVCASGAKIGIARIADGQDSEEVDMVRVGLQGAKTRAPITAIGILNDSGVFAAGKLDGRVLITG